MTSRPPTPRATTESSPPEGATSSEVACPGGGTARTVTADELTAPADLGQALRSYLTELAKDAPDYRRKDLFDARSFTANKVEIRRGADMLIFTKSGTGESEMWKNPAGQTVDLMKVEDLLSRLTNIRAVTFENAVPASLKMPNLAVAITFGSITADAVTASFAAAGSASSYVSIVTASSSASRPGVTPTQWRAW